MDRALRDPAIDANVSAVARHLALRVALLEPHAPWPESIR